MDGGIGGSKVGGRGPLVVLVAVGGWRLAAGRCGAVGGGGDADVVVVVTVHGFAGLGLPRCAGGPPWS